MVISFRVSRRGRRLYPPPPAPSEAVDDSRPHAAASLDGRSPHSCLLSEGMLLYLIGDDPKKQTYSRASKASLSDIEHGCLPLDILHGIPCKFRNGSTMCEVRDYRSVFSNGDDYLGDDFPRVNRVHLRLGTECVVKDLSSIVDASWTYHDQLTAESMILNSLQPRLNLDPTPCLEKLCNASTKKIDLGLNNQRLENKDTSVLVMSTNPPENCKPKEFNSCEGATLCNENAALEGIPSGILNRLFVKWPSNIHVNSAKSAVKSDANNTSQSSSTIPNTSALCDRRNEQQAQVENVQVDRKTGELQRVTVLPQKTMVLFDLLHEKHESEKCSPANKNGRSGYQISKGLHKSTSSPNKEELDLGSQERLQGQAGLGQAMGNRDTKVLKQVLLPVSSRDPYTSLNVLHIGLKECHTAPFVEQNNFDMEDVNGSGTSFVTSFSGCSRRAACEPILDMSASKRKASGISIISLNKEITLNVKTQQYVDTQIKPPCNNRSLEEPAITGGFSNQWAIDLELDKERQQTKDTSLHHNSTDAPENYMLNEFNVYKVAAACSENAALEGMPNATFNSLPLNYPSSIHFNNEKSVVEPDIHSAILPSSTLTNSSALCDRKQSGSATTAPDHLFQCNDERALKTVLQADCENRQPQRVTVVPQKRKKSLKLLNERHESEYNSFPNKTARLSSQNSIEEKSTGYSNKEGLHLGSPEGPQVEVKIGRAIGKKDMKINKRVPLSVHSSCHLCTSSNISNLCVQKIPEKVKSLHVRFKEHYEAPILGPKNSDMAYLKDSRTPSVISFSASSSKAACEPGEDKSASEPQLNSLNRKSCSGQPINDCEPDVEKILSEVILTTKRHGLNEKAAKSDVLETSGLLQPYEIFQSENVEEIPHMRDETITYHVSDGATSTWKTRRLTFHPSQNSSCNGLVDESQYTLCLLESEALDNHQITVGTINGDEHIHIATLPTSGHAEMFVDQFISLMNRDGYNLCNDEVCNEPSELTQQSKDVSILGYPTGEDVEYLMFSPSAVNSLPISKNHKVDCTFQNKLHANLLQPLTQQWILPEQPPTLEGPEAFLLNSSHLPGGLQYTSLFPQDQGSSFACYPYAMDPLQLPSVHSSLGVSMDQYLQCRDDILGCSDTHSASMRASRYSQLHQEVLRHDLPGAYGASTSVSRYNWWRQEVPMDQDFQYRYGISGFSDAYSASTSASGYGQWHQVYTQMGNVVYQWDLPVFSRNIHKKPSLHDGWSITLSEQEPPDELPEHGL